MTRNPLISVIMATFNEPPRYIEKAIKSILCQSYSNFEFLILDDSTNEETKSVIDSLALSDDRIKIIRKEKRMGFVPALNEGLKQSRGEFIARMDGDDISILNRFEIQAKYLMDNPNVDILGGGMNIINSEEYKTSHRSYPPKGWRLKIWSMFRNPLGHPTVMFRKKIVEDGYEYNSAQKMSEDLELWLRLYRKGYIIENLSTDLINYRISSDLGKKRTNNWKYNYKARVSNFTFRMPLFSIISILIAGIYCILPTYLISKVYKRENND